MRNRDDTDLRLTETRQPRLVYIEGYRRLNADGSVSIVSGHWKSLPPPPPTLH